jgi:hypothetical protein
VVDHSVVEVFTTQVGVTGCRFHFENTILDGKDRYIEGAPAQIENQNIPLASNLLVQPIRDGGRSWLVYDTEDVEAGNGAGILRGLSLVAFVLVMQTYNLKRVILTFLKIFVPENNEKDASILGLWNILRSLGYICITTS